MPFLHAIASPPDPLPGKSSGFLVLLGTMLAAWEPRLQKQLSLSSFLSSFYSVLIWFVLESCLFPTLFNGFCKSLWEPVVVSF
nr:MAG TPA: hypothetical protein [Caudoviricetes sp.]DAS18560.1 MAG TPA: hypothetical protein [Caudoviricetes sp.]